MKAFRVISMTLTLALTLAVVGRAADLKSPTQNRVLPSQQSQTGINGQSSTLSPATSPKLNPQPEPPSPGTMEFGKKRIESLRLAGRTLQGLCQRAIPAQFSAEDKTEAARYLSWIKSRSAKFIDLADRWELDLNRAAGDRNLMEQTNRKAQSDAVGLLSVLQNQSDSMQPNLQKLQNSVQQRSQLYSLVDQLFLEDKETRKKVIENIR